MSGESRLAFLGVGRLGWKVMAAALRAHSPDRTVLIDELVKGPTSPLGRQRFPTLTKVIDPHVRRRHSRLEAWIREHPHVEHVHCFGHLVAVPDVFERAGMTFSVSCDETWRSAVPLLYKPATAIERRWCDRRIAAEAAIFKHAAFVSCTSEWAATCVRTDYGVPTERVTCEPFPIVDPTEVPRSMEARRITFIGNDLARKGAFRLARWFETHWSENAELHVVSAEPIERWMRDIPGVVYHGRVDNAQIRTQVLPGTSVLVLPTSVDQSPLVLTEAAASGVPAVSSALAGIPELIIDGESGFLLDRNDDTGFIEAISRLIDDPDLNQRMGRRARDHFDQCLRPEVITKRLFELAGGQLV